MNGRAQGSCSFLRQEHIEESATHKQINTRSGKVVLRPNLCVELSSTRNQQVKSERPYTRRPSLVIITPPTTNENTSVQGLPALGPQRAALEVELMMNRLTHQLPSRDLTFIR